MRAVVLLLIAMILPIRVWGQEQPSASLITIGPGDLSYERYGHNMLRIRDPGRNVDVVFNWGIFDFEEPNFIFNFVQGRLIYWMAAGDTQGSLNFYRGQDRTIWIQELNLPPERVRQMLDYCEYNARPENREYRYDYFRDNCSTRVRDTIDLFAGGQIKQQATTMPSEVTYRSDTRRLMAEVFPLYVGLNFVLGLPTDQQLSAWEEMFIPMRLRERLNQIQMTDESGQRVPLVKFETVFHQSGHIVVRAEPPNWIAGFLLAGVMIGGALVGLGELARRNSRPGRWGLGISAALWGLFSGLAGLILGYLWLITDHAATRPNENILQLGPLGLVLVVLVPLALRRAKFARMAFFFTVAILGLSMVGWILQVLPIMDQINGEIIALALPAHGGLAWAMWRVQGMSIGASSIGRGVEPKRSS